MRQLLLGIVLGSTLTAVMVQAGDYLRPGHSSVQETLSDTRIRQALETIQAQRQDYLDQQVRDAGKLPCR